MMLNDRRDLEALRGTPDFAIALRAIAGATATWINTATSGPPVWARVTVLDTLSRLDLTEAELLDELQAAGIGPVDVPQPAAVAEPVKTTSDLVAYVDQKRDAVSDAGITVNIGTVEAPINVSADTTTAGRTDVLGLMQMGALGLPLTWHQASGSISITMQQLTTIALAIAAHRAAAVAVHTALWAGIYADPPTITTYQQIDAASWPS